MQLNDPCIWLLQGYLVPKHILKGLQHLIAFTNGLGNMRGDRTWPYLRQILPYRARLLKYWPGHLRTCVCTTLWRTNLKKSYFGPRAEDGVGLGTANSIIYPSRTCREILRRGSTVGPIGEVCPILEMADLQLSFGTGPSSIAQRTDELRRFA